ncbi:bifunctional metallophosphatase/5'-nucleotidase [Neobacillus notoginsengisoli]|uniref:Bifunctional metallophosphatase/5'-nucleotidase n=1 Tax=Neobacillus notoginsengisoli TaxID=1578198 RepID=A0A417YWJ4_9BACI|nr:bifunctional metallophosphatase/5'-nucleotidase [Neobacillus notoginsengisoli]RHW41953.1 bifunctional metallophosphatase/5'-nucleotidase [Neobacillus notoginsengisoli]
MVQEITIIQQNDTHGCLEMHEELFWGAKGPYLKKAGGFSRINQYVKDAKNKNPKVLFLDGGDLFHGTLPLVSSKGSAILPILKEMELDGFVPGNWDFAYGREQLKQLAESLPFPAIACNVKDEESGKTLFEPYFIKEMQGVKVGVIGLTYPYVDQTMARSFSKGLVFSKGLDEVRDIVQILKPATDLIVLLSHMGLPLDVKLASIVDGIDILLSGHSHDRVSKPIMVNDTIVVQAGSNSSFLGRLDIAIDNGRITGVNYQLIDIDEQLAEDSVVEELVQTAVGRYENEKKEIAGQTNSMLHRMTLNEAPMDQLITDAYMHSLSCDAAFSHGWRYGPPQAPGSLSMYDLHSIIPTNPKLFTLEVEGKELLNILEKNLEQVFSSDPFQQKGGYILRSSGLFMTYKPYNPKGHRIQTLQVGGKDINLSKTYKIAGGGQQLFKGMEEKKTYHEHQAIELIHSFLKDNGPYQADWKNRIISV